MRRFLPIALLLLAGCQKSFDDRYAEAEKKVRAQVESIDKELAAKASEAAMVPDASAAPSGAVGPTSKLR